MRDRIDERNDRERSAKSIVKYWNVNYLPPQKNAASQAPAAGDTADTDVGEDAGRSGAQQAGDTAGPAAYGTKRVDDEVTKGQIEKILREKTDAIRSLIEQNEADEQMR